jgi:hypothetical protein
VKYSVLVKLNGEKLNLIIRANDEKELMKKLGEYKNLEEVISFSQYENKKSYKHGIWNNNANIYQKDKYKRNRVFYS